MIGIALSKIAGDLLQNPPSPGSTSNDVQTTTEYYKNFKMTEKSGNMIFYNSKGDKLFSLSKDGDMTIGD